MRVYAVHLLNDYSGSPKVLMQLANGWVQQEVKVTIVTCNGHKGFLSDLPGVEYKEFWYKWSGNPYVRLIFFLLSQFLLLIGLLRVVKKHDIIYVNTVLPFGAAFLGKIKRCRIIYHVHETSVKPALLKKFLFGVMRWTATDIVYVSDYLAKQEHIANRRTHILPNAIEDKFLKEAKAYRRPEKKTLGNVLMVCSLKPYKGVNEFVTLAELNPTMQFQLVVNSSQVAIDTYFAGIKLPLNLIISHVQTNLHPFYHWADIIVNLSKPDAWIETFGLTIIEGMAHSLPALIPPVGGITELVEDGKNGYLADSRDIQALSLKLRRLCEPATYNVMKKTAAITVLKFSESNFIRESIQILGVQQVESHSTLWNTSKINDKILQKQHKNDWHRNSNPFERTNEEHMEPKKKVAIIGTVGLPANYGGFETLADQLVRNLSDQYELTVYCSGKRYPPEKRKEYYQKARLKYIPLDANGIQSIPYDSISIIHALFYADVLLILGVAGAWLLPFVKLFTNKKIVISIDGIEWKREKWSMLAKCYLWWAEKMAVQYSHIDISDNESIQDYTALRYGSLSRIIEYGADHTIFVQPGVDDKLKYPFLKNPYAFKVCRIEPENNVHEVLEAFSQLPQHTFVMVGNWNNSEYGIGLREKYRVYANIIMLDPIYEQRTLDVLRGNALVYIHGHSAGGTNPSLVEAMYLGLPVVAFNVSYNKTTTENKALYFTNANDLIAIIQGTSISKFKEIGVVMNQIARRRYTWKLIANKYASLIQEALMVKAKSLVMSRISSIDKDILVDYEAGHLKHARLFFEKP